MLAQVSCVCTGRLGGHDGYEKDVCIPDMARMEGSWFMHSFIRVRVVLVACYLFPRTFPILKTPNALYVECLKYSSSMIIWCLDLPCAKSQFIYRASDCLKVLTGPDPDSLQQQVTQDRFLQECPCREHPRCLGSDTSNGSTRLPCPGPWHC